MRVRLTATRQNLIRLRRRQERARGGLRLLKDKREALMRAFLSHVSKRVHYHDLLEERLRETVSPLVDVLAGEAVPGLQSFGGAARRELALDVKRETIWGVSVATFHQVPLSRDYRERGFDAEGAGWAVNRTADRFEAVLDLILETATTEVRIKRLAEEINKAGRRINALEGRILPLLRSAEKKLHETLEEAERDEHQRLRRLKRIRKRAALEVSRGALPDKRKDVV
jgi:V/A-type H+-transporting ATPase subunit D